jgi:hypothetical protein
MSEPVERVINVVDGLVLTIGLAGEITQSIIDVAFRQSRRERRLRNAPEFVINE